MADANVDSVQQAQDAQNLDNLTSLQQTDSATTPQPTGGTADATVTTTNPSPPDTPSLYNDAIGTNNNQVNLEAAGTNSLLDTTTFTNDGRDGAANESPTVGSDGTFGTEVNAGDSQVQYTVTNEAPVIQGAGTNGTQNTVDGTQGGVAAEGATATEAGTATALTDAAVTNTTPAPTLNADGTPATDPTVDPLNVDPTQQEPVAVLRTPNLTIAKTALITNEIIDGDNAIDSVDDDVTYTISVENTGNTTLTNVKVVDSMFERLYDSLASKIIPHEGGNLTIDKVQVDTVDGNPVYEYSVTIKEIPVAIGGAKSVYAFSYEINITQSDIDGAVGADGLTANTNPDVDNEAAVVGGDQFTSLGNDSKLSVEAEVEVLRTPNLTIAKTALITNEIIDGDNAIDSVDDDVTYTISVENTGNTTLTNVKVVDSMFERLYDSLASKIIPHEGGNLTIDKVQVDTVDGNPVYEYSVTIKEIPVAIGGAKSVYAFSYEINITQSDIDGAVGADGLTANTNPDVDNEAAVVGGDQFTSLGNDSKLSVEAEVEVLRTPNLTIAKTALITNEIIDGDNAIDSVDDDVTYTISVENTGNTTLTNVKVVDSMFERLYDSLASKIIPHEGGNLTIDKVQVDTVDGNPVYEYSVTIKEIPVAIGGAKSVYAFSYEINITQSDIDGARSEANDISSGNLSPNPDVDNEAAVVGGDQFTSLGNDSKLSVEAEVEVLRTPNLTIAKTALITNEIIDGDNAIDSVDDDVTYTISVENTGNTTLTNVKVVDSMFERLYDSLASKIIPHEGGNLTIDKVQVDTVDGNPVYEYSVTIKEIPVAIGGAKSVYAFSYEINITQSDIDGARSEANDISSGNLSPNPDIDNVATVTNMDGGLDSLVNPTLSVTAEVETSRIDDLELVKSSTVKNAPGQSVNLLEINDKIDYTLMVTNVGNTSQTNVQVFDSMFDKIDLNKINAWFDSDGNGAKDLGESVAKFSLSPSNNNILIFKDPIPADVNLIIQYSVEVNDSIIEPDSYHSQTITMRDLLEGNGELNGPQGTTYALYYDNYGPHAVGQIAAYSDKDNQLSPYSSFDADAGEQAKFFINNDNTNGAVGVGSGVMHGDRNGSHDHIMMTFDEPRAKSVSLQFTQATTVELAFSVKSFEGTDTLYRIEILSHGSGTNEILDYKIFEGSGADKQIIDNALIALSYVDHNSAEGAVWTLNYTGNGYIQGYDFWVVGGLNNEVSQSGGAQDAEVAKLQTYVQLADGAHGNGDIQYGGHYWGLSANVADPYPGQGEVAYIVLALDSSGNILANQPNETISYQLLADSKTIDATEVNLAIGFSGSVKLGESFLIDVLGDSSTKGPGESFALSLSGYSDELISATVDYGVNVSTTIIENGKVSAGSSLTLTFDSAALPLDNSQNNTDSIKVVDMSYELDDYSVQVVNDAYAISNQDVSADDEGGDQKDTEILGNVDSVTLKLFAVVDSIDSENANQYRVYEDSNGDKHYLTSSNSIYEPGISNVNQEGSEAKYIVLAEDAGGDFLDPTMQGGRITINIQNINSTNADHEQLSGKQVLGTIFAINALDDYVADNNESFKLSLSDDWSWSPGYDSISYSNVPVTTAIYDETFNDVNVDSISFSDNDTVTLKVIAVDASGNPLTDVTANSGVEGEKLYYKVIATVDGKEVSGVTGEVKVVFADKTGATGASDYLKPVSMAVNVGEKFSADLVDDYSKESLETYTVSLDQSSTLSTASAYEKVELSTEVVTSTITDESVLTAADTVTLKVIAVDASGNPLTDVTANSGVEGEKLYYKVIATVDGKEVSGVTGEVKVVFADKTGATGASDYLKPVSMAVNVGEKFSADLVDDYSKESLETYTVSLDQSSTLSTASAYEKVELSTEVVTSTITDESVLTAADTVTLKVIAVDASGNPLTDVTANSGVEGEKLYYKVIATVDGKEVSGVTGEVKVVFADKTGATGASDYLKPVSMAVNVGEKFSADLVDDYSKESLETYTVSLDQSSTLSTASAYEKVELSTEVVTSTITDESVLTAADTVTLKVIAVDASGNPLTDVTANSGVEGEKLYYKVIATVDGKEVSGVTGEVKVVFADKTGATGASDYLKPVSMAVNVGEKFSADLVDDYSKESLETYTVSLDQSSTLSTASAYEKVELSTEVVTSTITDESVLTAADTVTLKVIAVDASGNPLTDVTANSGVEGEKLYYKVIATVDGKEVSGVTGEVKVVFADKTGATGASDYLKPVSMAVNVGEKFSADLVDDYSKESLETYTVSLDQSSTLSTASAYEKVELSTEVVTSTITDESVLTAADTVTLKVIAVDASGNPLTDVTANSGVEGEKLYYKVIATVDGKEVSGVTGEVKVVFADKTGATGASDYLKPVSMAVNVGEKFSADLVDDYSKESLETYTVSLDQSSTLSTASAYEKVELSTEVVTSTITDESVLTAADTVTLKVIAVDASGNPLTDVTANSGVEGEKLYYKVIATVDGKEVSGVTGEVKVVFADKTGATGASDYLKPVSMAVNVGEKFSADLVDDYSKESLETYTVSLDQSSTLSTASAYEKVELSTEVVTSTITDNDTEAAPNISLQKEATLKDHKDLVDGIDDDKAIDSTDDYISYLITVTNDGNIPLTGVKVYDPMFKLAVDSNVILSGVQVIVNNSSTSIMSDEKGYYVTIDRVEVGRSVEILYDYNIRSSDLANGIDSISNFFSPGAKQGNSIDLAYGTFSAYLDDGVNQYSTTKLKDAAIFVNTDNAPSGYALGIDAGVMDGSRTSSSEHLLAEFGDLSIVKSAQIQFTNASSVDLAFKADNLGSPDFIGFLRIYSDKGKTLIERYQVNNDGTSTKLASSGEFTYSILDTKGGDQGTIYTLKYSPSAGKISSFDFWVVGDNSGNNNANIKVIDVGFGKTGVTNIATAISDQDSGIGQDDHIDSVTVYAAGYTTPIIFDMNADGEINYLSSSAGVHHDFNGDGVAESTAWIAPEDGLLALQKEDGTHNIVFSTQAGETDLQGLAKVYDSNKDGVLDAKDADFAKFGVWQDTDSDGVVDSGEYLTLADRGIASLSLTSDGQVHFEANGDVIVYGQTTYTTADGELHIAEDVGFAVNDVYEPLDIAAIIANADAIESVTRIDQLAETDSSSSLMVELGGQTYEIATLLGQEVGTQDILSQFVGGDTSANLLTNKSWTDVIDIASDHGGPGAIIAAGGTLDEGAYANGEGDWTVVINSGDAKVDATNNQITFSSDSAENSVTITTADGSSHNIDNVDKIQWHG